MLDVHRLLLLLLSLLSGLVWEFGSLIVLTLVFVFSYVDSSIVPIFIGL